MFEGTAKANIFGCAPGVDFSKSLVEGLIARQTGQPPENMARVEIFVNTRRMQRRVLELFDRSSAGLLPKIRLVTDIANDPFADNLPAAVSPLRRRLEIAQLISKLLEQQPELFPRSALFDLAESLALLLAEMQDEAVTPLDIFNLDVADSSGHWQRSQQFLEIVTRYFDRDSSEPPDQETRQRRVIEALANKWADSAPKHPVIVAGSTGSRGSTALLMQAVAKCPQGALILPGFDFDLPDAVWDHLCSQAATEDHPQFRLARTISKAGVAPGDVQRWQTGVLAPSAPRNRLVSLALRPAPVTSQWLSEGPGLTHIDEATKNISLIEAPSERAEALAIALALREAAEKGITAALVTPDRLLTRRVKAALDQWRIEPDVSAGDPLDQTAPGRLLRHVTELFGATLSAETLLVLLKHPLVNTGAGDRGKHLQWSRELELRFRKKGKPFPAPLDIQDWVTKEESSGDRIAWGNWLIDTLFGLGQICARSLSDHLRHHLSIVSALVAGPGSDNSDDLWEHPAGQAVLQVIDALKLEANHGGNLSPFDYTNLLHSVLKGGEVRDPILPHTDIMIWGTLEARVQGAELVILGGLNEGVWPEYSTADPWLNRDMRSKVGLFVPERRIGLSAHDFQQAIAAKRVILSRSIRNADAQTVPSRWLNRLTNLMDGMSDEGRNAAENMQENGQKWLNLADALENPPPVKPASRPSPVPPLATRPSRLQVTAISRLIRDPYAIYARDILKLKPISPLQQEPDARLRGTILHRIFETFIRDIDAASDAPSLKQHLLDTADQILSREAPWPVTRTLWRAKLERITDVFLRDETLRQSKGRVVGLEVMGKIPFSTINFALTAKADRIDRNQDGSLLIYDYKSGALPTVQQQRYFDKQLLLEAVIAGQGGFENVPASPVVEVGHIGIGSNPKFEPQILSHDDIQTARSELIKLIAAYQDASQGYTARRAMSEVRFVGDYDHLARFGEWDDTDEPVPVVVGK